MPAIKDQAGTVCHEWRDTDSMRVLVLRWEASSAGTVRWDFPFDLSGDLYEAILAHSHTGTTGTVAATLEDDRGNDAFLGLLTSTNAPAVNTTTRRAMRQDFTTSPQAYARDLTIGGRYALTITYSGAAFTFGVLSLLMRRQP